MEEDKKIKISFVVPCFNDGDSIQKQIESIRDQDLPDIEIVVVNDGSTDNSKEILDGLKEQGKINKLIHFEMNKGACNARNEGAKVAEGKYLSFLPADAILYPGVARNWYETLEEFEQYDFLYGGYRFIDEEGEPLPSEDYLAAPFDPYLLEVTNYIDGSFPIRRDSYWKFAEIMKQPDGLWDSKIKSLQDWDFWLSIVKNGGKGVYVQDVFFGTTVPHPGGLSYDSSENWLERTEAIKAKHNIPIRRLCVASLGANYHAKRVAYILGADFKEMPSFKPHRYDSIYSIGFYPQFAQQQDAMFLNNLYKPEQGRTPAKKVIHFIGTDVFQLYDLSMKSLKVWQNYLKNNIDVILCESDFIQEELKQIGIEAKIIPIPPAKLYDVIPLPKDFTVAVYMPQVNREFYRPVEMAEIAKRLPDVKFKFFGNPAQVGKDPALTDNLEYAGYVNMDDFIKDCSAIIRFPLHDGLPLSVLEFLTAGRYSIQSVPIKHTATIPNFDIDTIVETIKQVKSYAEQNGANVEASQYWREELNHDKYRKAIEEVTVYQPKEFWENRARQWIVQAAAMKIEVDEVKEFYQKVNPKSVLDIGCGDGRWVPHLQEWGMEKYTGIDISEGLIKAAKLRFPHLEDNFHASKVEDLATPPEKYDLIFSYTVLEHIKPQDWTKAAETLKKIGKKLLLIEPIDFTSRYYCHSHPYRETFKVLEEKKLSDKYIILCNLE